MQKEHISLSLILHSNQDISYKMLAEKEKHQQVWQGTELKAIHAIVKKAKEHEGKNYELGFMELNNCYAYLDKMMAHEPSKETNYEFQYWQSLAFIHLSIQEDEQFLKCCQVLSRKFADKLEVLRLLVSNGTSFRECGKYDHALRVFQMAKKLVKNFDETNEELKKLQATILSNQSFICIEKSEYTAAIEKLSQAKEKDPQKLEYLCILPSFYIWNKDYDRIRESLDSCQNQIMSDQIKRYLRKYKTMLKYLNSWKQTAEKLKEISDKAVINRQILSYIDLIESCSSISQEEYAIVGRQVGIASNQSPIARLKNQIDADFQRFSDQGNQNLLYFYNGFCNAFQGSYTQSKLMVRGKFTVNTDNLAVSVASKIATFLPFFGELVSTAIESISSYITETQLMRMSKNICNIHISALKFDDFAQEVVVEITKNNESFLKKLDLDIPVLYDWPNAFSRLIEYLQLKKEQLQDKIFGESSLLKNDIEKYGYLVASKLISAYVATGEIYDKSKPNVREKKAQIIKKMIDKTKQIIFSDIEQYNSEKQVAWRDKKRKQNQENKPGQQQLMQRPPKQNKKPQEAQQKVSFFAKCCACLS